MKKITATIKGVNEAPREYTNDKGTTFYVNGDFQEGQFSVGVRERAKAESLIAELQKLAGTPHEYEVEERGERNGRPQFNLKGWPGRPAYQPGGGGRPGGGSYQPRYRDSEQGAKEERDSIARSVALQQAVLYVNNNKEEGKKLDPCLWTTTIADHFYEWLVKNNKPISQPFDPGPQRATPASPAQVQAQSKQASQMVERANTLFNDPEPPKTPPSGGYKEMACPECGESKAVRKSKLDGTPPWYCYKKIGGCGHQWGDFSPQLHGDPPAGEPKSPAVLASEEIHKSVKSGDMAHLKKVMDRIAERACQGVFTPAEVDELSIETETAMRAIQSGQSYRDWYDATLKAVQNREQETHPDLQELADRF